MNIYDIYREHRIGSQGFVNAIQTHCGLEASPTEIERIAQVAPTPERFMEVWEEDDDWNDAKHQAVYPISTDSEI